MGKYNGSSMLWRCMDVNENGALVIADSILCFKPFDAAGNEDTASHGRSSNSGAYRKLYGSNYWADSNIRSWLNSSKSAGYVEWLCGNKPVAENVARHYNEYDNEAGFLANFSADERAVINEVVQKSILDKNEYADMSAFGNESFVYNISRENSVSNYETAYCEQVTDKVFLLDVAQLETLSNNLGVDYAKGIISENTFSNADNLVENGFAAGKNWAWWLRTPVAEESCFGVYVRYVMADASEVGLDYAMQSHIGIRPAFYINTSIADISGAGTAENPYTVKKLADEITAGNSVYSRYLENVVNVSGNAGAEYAGEKATVILIPKESYNKITTAKHIGAAEIASDGSYNLKFKADADENDIVVVKLSNKDISYSVNSAKASKELPVSFVMDYNSDSKVELNIRNLWLENPEVKVIIGVYNSNDTLINCFVADKSLDFIGGEFVSVETFKEGRIKAFIWDDDNITPLAVSKEYEIPTLSEINN